MRARTLPTMGGILMMMCAAAMAACRDSPGPSAPDPGVSASSEPPSMSRPAPPTGRDRNVQEPILSTTTAAFPTFDSKLAEVAIREPSFAGVYRAEDGEVTVLLTDVSRLAPARQALSEVMRDDRLSAATRVEPADHPYDRLFQWKLALTPVLAMPGAISLDIDESRNRLVIGILDLSDRPSVEEAVESRGVPLEVVSLELSAVPAFGATLEDKWRPVAGGPKIETSASKTCTLGFNAEVDGTPVFATNGHCTETFGGIEGTDFSQDDYPWDDLGTEYFEEEAFSSYDNAECPTGLDRCKYTEIALGEYDDSDDWQNGYVLRPIERDPDESSIVVDSTTLGIYSEELWPLENDVVEKIGITTGWTYGEVDKTCETTPAEGGRHLLCQYSAIMGGDEGDSGSGIFMNYSGDWMDIVGQYWGQLADTVYFTPWNSIQVVVYNEIGDTLDPVDW